MNDEQLKGLYARAMAKRAPRAGTCEVPLEAMLAVLERRGSETERMETLRRVFANSACQEEFELLRAMVQAAAERPKRRLSPVWGWAAAIVVLLGAGWWWRDSRQNGEIRGAPEAVSLVEPIGAIAAPAPPLTWHPLSGAFRYDIVLVDSAGQARFAGSTTDTLLALPDTLTLTAGGVYRWWVRAFLPDGTEERSATGSFTIQP